MTHFNNNPDHIKVKPPKRPRSHDSDDNVDLKDLHSVYDTDRESEPEELYLIYSNKERHPIGPNIARQTDYFDRFLVMKPINPTDDLTGLSIVKLGNQLKKIGIKPANVTNMKNQLTIQRRATVKRQ